MGRRIVVCALGAVLVAAAGNSSAEPRPGSVASLPDSLARVSVAQRSPTGRIAFSTGGPQNEDIYAVNVDGSGLRRLTTHPDNEFDPTWSPNGRRIAYRHQRSGDEEDSEIYVMNADGSGKRNLTRAPGVDLSPAWSPDGQRIAFASNRSGELRIWVMRADGSGQRRLSRIDGEYPTWSPNGRKIAFDHNALGAIEWDIWVMNADGSRARPLISSPATEQGPAWSPNGRTIAYQSNRGSASDVDRIWLANADGSRQRRLTARPGERPAWSPDGAYVLFTWNTLFVVRPNGTGTVALPVSLPGAPVLADWSR